MGELVTMPSVYRAPCGCSAGWAGTELVVDPCDEHDAWLPSVYRAPCGCSAGWAGTELVVDACDEHDAWLRRHMMKAVRRLAIPLPEPEPA